MITDSGLKFLNERLPEKGIVFKHPAEPDHFVLTRDPVFELVEQLRSKAAREVRSRRQMTSTGVVRAFATGSYVTFDECAETLLQKAGLTLNDYRDWRRSR